MALKKAKRQKLRGAIAIIGPSGSGKTLGGLLLAYGMMKAKYPDLPEEEVWDKVGLIDTEHERALVYEGMVHQGVRIGQFWHYNLQKPYSVPRFEQAANEMKAEGVEVLVTDSLSHAWMGEGGVLDYHDVQGGRFQSWNDTNKGAYFPLVSFATGESTGLHMINTIRAKQEHAMQPDENGKMQVVKLGLQPVQRDQFEYEFQVVFNVDMDHRAGTSKDNSGLFEGKRDPLSPEHGKMLYDWLEAGVDIFAEREAEAKRIEAERQELIKHIRLTEEDHGLQELVKSYETHPALNKPIEQFSHTQLTSLYSKIQEKITETTKEEK